ncbi:MAG: hypothetical protein J6Q68_05440 [Clostridia bacterium]|nr:hypothetical protein [Clostridia bacterium]
MKKSVVILIGVIYIASVVLVSFFGLEFKIFEPVIDVERIEITNPGQKYSDLWGEYIVIYPDENGEWICKIDYQVYPANATTPKVEFGYDKQTSGVYVSEDGVVQFSKPAMIKIQVLATDGSGASDTITIVAR